MFPPAEVLDVVADLPRSPRPGLRWTRRDQWHVTLRFLGSVDLDEASEALAALSAAGTDAVVGPAVEVLGRSVVAVPVAGVDDLASGVVAVTEGVGEPPADRPFRGHLTLARARGSARGVALVGHPVSASFPVSEVHLVRSDSGSDGPDYTVVSTVPLG